MTMEEAAQVAGWVVQKCLELKTLKHSCASRVKQAVPVPGAHLPGTRVLISVLLKRKKLKIAKYKMQETFTVPVQEP